MPRTASLEIHQINVGQGDSILVVNRDAVALKQLCVANGFDTCSRAGAHRLAVERSTSVPVGTRSMR